jgi:hypothetical protein
VTAATADQMRARTNWGELLPSAGRNRRLRVFPRPEILDRRFGRRSGDPWVRQRRRLADRGSTVPSEREWDLVESPAAFKSKH